jgi:zinc transporter 9
MGLVIHSLSDGIALGVSLFFSFLFKQEDSTLGIVIFFAILMHKIPTAVGLGTFLS